MWKKTVITTLTQRNKKIRNHLVAILAQTATRRGRRWN
jgi:hypothetical protein